MIWFPAARTPFRLGFFTLNNAADDIGTGNGFSLDYTQVYFIYIYIYINIYIYIYIWVNGINKDIIWFSAPLLGPDETANFSKKIYTYSLCFYYLLFIIYYLEYPILHLINNIFQINSWLCFESRYCLSFYIESKTKLEFFIR